jgi:hypothetical protein
VTKAATTGAKGAPTVGGKASGPGRARKTVTGKGAGDDLLARAQGRAGGNVLPARPAPVARRAPAAWIKAAEKAAESVAARAGRAADVPEKTRAVGVPEATAGAVAGGAAGNPGAAAGVAPGRAVGASEATAGAVAGGATGNPGATAAAAANRPLSYREEAAELLGGERRRRRTVSGRSRPKADPPASGEKTGGDAGPKK